MQNDAPLVTGPTPDSEENNNMNEKESPGPSTIEAGAENYERNEGQATPKSAGSDVTAETPEGVTVECKAPDVEDECTGQMQDGEKEKNNENKKPEETEKSESAKEIDQTPEGKEGRESMVESEKKKEEKPPDDLEDKDARVAASDGGETEAKPEAKNETSKEADGKDDETTNESENDMGKKCEHTANSVNKLAENGADKQPEEGKNNNTVSEPNVDESKAKDERPLNVESSVAAENGEIDSIQAEHGEKKSEPVENQEVQKLESEGKEENVDEKTAETKVEDKAEEPPLSHEELLTRYHSTELQLEGLQEQNSDLKEKIKVLENEIKQLKQGTDNKKQRDGYIVQTDFLARELNQTQDAEKFLKEKVAELLQEKEEAEKKSRDLQLRLKRFAKDDKAKDERISKMDAELKEITEMVQELEVYVDEETKIKIKGKRSSTCGSSRSVQSDMRTKNTDINKMNTNRSYRDPGPIQRSKTCVII